MNCTPCKKVSTFLPFHECWLDRFINHAYGCAHPTVREAQTFRGREETCFDPERLGIEREMGIAVDKQSFMAKICYRLPLEELARAGSDQMHHHVDVSAIH